MLVRPLKNFLGKCDVSGKIIIFKKDEIVDVLSTSLIEIAVKAGELEIVEGVAKSVMAENSDAVEKTETADFDIEVDDMLSDVENKDKARKGRKKKGE